VVVVARRHFPCICHVKRNDSTAGICYCIGLTLGSIVVSRPVESYRGARETIIGGPISLSQPHSICAEIETLKASRGEGCEEGCPLTIRLGVWGSVVSCRKWILCIFEVRKKPSGTHFSVFLSDGGAPKL